MQMIFALLLSLAMALPAIAADPSGSTQEATTSLKEAAASLKRVETSLDNLGLTLKRVETSLDNIRDTTRDQTVAKNIQTTLVAGGPIYETLKSVDINMKSAWNATFVLLVVAVGAVIASLGAQQYLRQRVIKATDEIARLAQIVTAAKARPLIDSVAPENGPVIGGTLLTIDGLNFQPRARVSLRGNQASNVRFVSQTRITALTPSGTSGAADVTVENPDGELFVRDRAFTYAALAPELGGVAPDRGPVAGGIDITLWGANFRQGAEVRLGAVAPPTWAFLSPNGIRLRLPAAAAAGPVDVTVMNPDGQQNTRPGAFTYV